MTQIANIIPQLPSPSISTYDFTDIATGLGTEIFYLSSVNSTGPGVAYILIDTAIQGSADASVSSGTYINFDSSSFNSPRTVKGTAYITGEAAAASSSTATFQIAHFDGSTETIIGSETVTESLSGGGDYFAISFDLTETTFKVGDVLRVKMKTGGTTTVSIDPLENSPNGVQSVKLYIPFRILN